MNTDLSICRGLRDERRADIGIAADEAGVIGTDKFDAGSVNDPDQLDLGRDDTKIQSSDATSEQRRRSRAHH